MDDGAGTDGSDLDGIVTALYAVDLDAFMAERAATAKQLRSEGSRELAAAVAKVRKPTLAAWAINAAARADAARVESLIAVGERLRAAQDALLNGASPDELRAALDDRRSIIRPIADDAVARMTAAGGNGDAARDDIVATLEAASLDAGVAAELAGGRLAKTTRGPVGFELLGLGGATTEAAPATARAPEASDDDQRRVREAARQRAAEARAVADQAKQAVAGTREEVARLEDVLERAQRDLDRARAALADAEGVAERAERDADEAAEAARAAER